MFGIHNTFGKYESRWRESWRHKPLDAPGVRARANFDMYLFDHGFLRLFFTNRAEVAPDVFRSNQPTPKQIARFAAQGGKTILNFRGENSFGGYLLEKEACKKHGIQLVNFRFSARGVPSREQFEAYDALLPTLEKPLLMHCKSGADRAGIGATLYQIYAQGKDVREASRQLSPRFLHIAAARTGILDHIFKCALKDGANSPDEFRQWIRSDFDQAQISATFRANRGWSWFTDKVLRREG